MKYKIGFVGPTNIVRGKLKESIDSMCELIYIKSDNVTDQAQMVATYKENAHRVDGFIFSGLIQYIFLKNEFEHFEVPVECLNFSEKDFYKYLYKLVERDRAIDISRIFFDFLREDNNYYNIYDGEENQKMPYTTKDVNALQNINKVAEIYEKSLEKHKELWENGKIDLSVTRSYSNFEALEEFGYKCDYLFPSDESIIKTFSKVISKIDFEKNDMNRPATFIITINAKEFLNEDFIFKIGRVETLIYDCVLGFLKSNDIYNVTVLQDALKLEISTTKENVLKMTNNYTCSLLLNYIKGKIDIDINMGCGIGNTMINATNNAILANKLSFRGGINSLYIVDEKENEYGPFYETGEEVSIKNNHLIDEISEKVPLSKANISKIISIIEERKSDEITGEVLSEYMKITTRSANRILTTLCNCNMAYVAESKQESKRGRPKRVYKIKLI